jgi:hypothetical protein
MSANFFIAYWDTLGFETIIDLTEQDKRAMWSSLAEKEPPRRLPVGLLIMRAKANPQRFPEVWTFQSELDETTLTKYSIESPQELADLIREHGTKVFTTQREKEVIK